MVRVANKGNLKGQNLKKSPAGDARNRIIAKNRKNFGDAREKLAKLAKSTDARQKLEKIRNLKQGKLDVKKTAKGGITITKTTKGELLLTTKKKDGTKSTKKNGSSNIGHNLTKSIGKGGAISIRTKPKNTAIKKSTTTPSRLRGGAQQSKKLTRTIRGHVSAAAKLDDELINTHVDPVILKRTVRQDIIRERERSPLHTGRYYGRGRSPPESRFYDRPVRRERSRSPIGMDYEDNRENLYNRRSSAPLMRSRPGRFDYDDPRREMEREEELYRRRLREDESRHMMSANSTMAEGSTYVSPLQGVKVIVSNLQPSVSQEDIIELFGGVGALKRAKVTSPGTAEVVFVNKADANKAVEIYHNRQLDGKAMRCQIVGASSGFSSNGSSGFKLPASLANKRNSEPERKAAPDLASIHRALFNERKRPGQGIISSSGGAGSAMPLGVKPVFTVTMPKKGNNRTSY